MGCKVEGKVHWFWIGF